MDFDGNKVERKKVTKIQQENNFLQIVRNRTGVHTVHFSISHKE